VLYSVGGMYCFRRTGVLLFALPVPLALFTTWIFSFSSVRDPFHALDLQGFALFDMGVSTALFPWIERAIRLARVFASSPVPTVDRGLLGSPLVSFFSFDLGLTLVDSARGFFFFSSKSGWCRDPFSFQFTREAECSS